MKQEAQRQLEELLLTRTFKDSKVIISRLNWHDSSKNLLEKIFEQLEDVTN